MHFNYNPHMENVGKERKTKQQTGDKNGSHDGKLSGIGKRGAWRVGSRRRDEQTGGGGEMENEASGGGRTSMNGQTPAKP